MKNLILILASILLAVSVNSCTDEKNPINPYDDSANIKLIVQQGFYNEVPMPEAKVNDVIIINFNGNVYKYGEYYDKQAKGTVLKLEGTATVSDSFLESLDNLFVQSGFSAWKKDLPLNRENLYPMWPGSHSEISWRINKDSQLKKVSDYSSWTDTPEYPEHYQDFRSSLDSKISEISF